MTHLCIIPRGKFKKKIIKFFEQHKIKANVKIYATIIRNKFTEMDFHIRKMESVE